MSVLHADGEVYHFVEYRRQAGDRAAEKTQVNLYGPRLLRSNTFEKVIGGNPDDLVGTGPSPPMREAKDDAHALDRWSIGQEVLPED